MTRHGAHIDVLDGSELRDIEPHISDRYAQAVLIRDQGYAANPGRLVKGLARQVAARTAETSCRAKYADSTFPGTA